MALRYFLVLNMRLAIQKVVLSNLYSLYKVAVSQMQLG